MPPFFTRKRGHENVQLLGFLIEVHLSCSLLDMLNLTDFSHFRPYKLLRIVEFPIEGAQLKLQQLQQELDTLLKSANPLPSEVWAQVFWPSEFRRALVDLNTANPGQLQEFLDTT